MIAFLILRLTIKPALILVLLFSWYHSAFAQPVLTVRFTDEAGKPMLVAIDRQTDEPPAGRLAVPQLSNSSQEGVVEIIGNSERGNQLAWAFAKGFAIDLVNVSLPRSRSMEVAMRPESEIQVVLVHRDGRPISNARISPGFVHFRRAAWLASAPHRLPVTLESRTDANGNAKLLGALFDELKSIRVSLDDTRGCTFLIPERWDRQSPLRIVWGTDFGTLVCRVLDREGNPVGGAMLYANTNESHINANVITVPTRNFTEYLGETDKDGLLKVENVPSIPIDIRLFGSQPGMGQGEYRKEIMVEAGKTTEIKFQLKPVFPCLISIVDSTDAEYHEGIEIQYQLIDDQDNITAYAKTNQDGVCELAAQIGNWRFAINDSSLPDGYCIYHPERSELFNVTQSNEMQTPPPLYIGKGQLVQGKLLRIDIKQLRYDWLIAGTKTDGQWRGTLDEQGDFRVVVPNYVPLDSIDEFQIADGGKGLLSIESQVPLVLKWTQRKED